MDAVIIGAGGHGKVAAEILRISPGEIRASNARPSQRGKGRRSLGGSSRLKLVGFLDADESLVGQSTSDLPVLGGINLLARLRTEGVGAAFVAIGDNRARLRYLDAVRQAGLRLLNAVHPAAVVSPSVTMGENVLLAAGAVVCAETLLGDAAIVNTSAVVDHECAIGRGCHVCPAAAIAGRVRVGEGAFVGLGSRVIQCLSVGAWSTIGAGAVVIGDVADGETVVGVPARAIRVTSVGRAA
jgi:UDP-perosamine 4-acetyltransferase